MASWIFNNLVLAAALTCAAGSALLMAWYLVRRPALSHATKLVLLLGIGVLPIATAATGNVVGFQATEERHFCGSCHVMAEYRADSDDPHSATLAARHARNASFGDENCYGCHADYGMFGTFFTKLGGLRHIYENVFHYDSLSPAEARAKIHIRTPFLNSTCIHCHSTDGPIWNKVPSHASLLDRLRDGSVSCASAGCHGPAHPFSKSPAVAR